MTARPNHFVRIWQWDEETAQARSLGVHEDAEITSDPVTLAQSLWLGNRLPLRSELARTTLWYDRGWVGALALHLSSRLSAGVKLPGAIAQGGDCRAALVRGLMTRRTKRTFTSEPVTLKDLGNLLPYATQRAGKYGFRIDVLAYRVENLANGVYLSKGTRLRRLGPTQKLADAMVDVYFGMTAPRSASFTLVLRADIAAWRRRAPDAMGLRAMYVAAGIVMQAMLVEATNLGLGALVTPAMRDSRFAEITSESQEGLFPAVYTATFGKAKHGAVGETHDLLA